MNTLSWILPPDRKSRRMYPGNPAANRLPSMGRAPVTLLPLPETRCRTEESSTDSSMTWSE